MAVAIRVVVMLLAFLAGAGPVAAYAPETNSVASLRAKFAGLRDQLSHNQYQRALYIESGESPGASRGESYALVEYPLATVYAAFSSPIHWCDVMLLHLNTKYCQALTGRAGSALMLSVGKKFDQPLTDAYKFEFNFHAAPESPDYLQILLNADSGPLGTSNYRITLEAVAVDSGRTFLHFAYSFGYGFIGRIALQAYLATAGRDKVGFTVTGSQPNGQPDYVRGVRGMAERNTMRYYLAIDAYLRANAAPREEQLERRLEYWFDATERYRRQLHEMERSAYLEMKRGERRGQQVPQ